LTEINVKILTSFTTPPVLKEIITEDGQQNPPGIIGKIKLAEVGNETIPKPAFHHHLKTTLPTPAHHEYAVKQTRGIWPVREKIVWTHLNTNLALDVGETVIKDSSEDFFSFIEKFRKLKNPHIKRFKFRYHATAERLRYIKAHSAE
jgi:hypothetical protein